MAPKRILLKVSHTRGGQPFAAAPFRLSGVGFQVKPLFEVPAAPARADHALDAEAARERQWFLAEPDAKLALDRWGGSSEWDLAHRVLEESLGGRFGLAGDARLLAVEPDLEQVWPVEPPPGMRGPALAPLAACQPEPQKNGDLAKGPGFAWHLESRFSDLRRARDAVSAAGSEVTVVHLDTGYDPNHSALPEGLDTARQKNFREADRPDDATDLTPAQGPLNNRGHGTGTLGILAGGKLQDVRPQEANTNDYLGGAPLARVVPVRIADSVVHFRTSSVAQGIDYARRIGADIVSMSMGGYPSAAWADAVNAAYDAGVVIVCAAGNNFGGLPTSAIVWPARFHRVIAACGIMADDRPYFHLPAWVMQGNYGPPSKMATAMAAYTPNIPWPKIDCAKVIDLDGAGTSSATPQVAAAAALWLRKFKPDVAATYDRPWMRVEAVRNALFESAQKRGPGAPAVHTYFGNGVLNAHAALALQPAAAGQLREQPRDHAVFPFLRTLLGVPIDADPRLQLLHLELTQVAVGSKAAREAVPDPGIDPAQIAAGRRRMFLEGILDEGKCSLALRSYLEAQLGRVSSLGEGAALPPASRAPPVPARPRRAVKPRAAPPPVSVAPQPQPRQVRRRPPARRNLQIFAADPGLSNRLETAFINRTVVGVRWEADSASDNLLQPGPVGEYLEIVDVDPASRLAYDPVDLNDPLLLAQSGLAPSEGNPQFHQQMVYAVAMRTIESFEVALGRTALWATKRIETPATDPETGEDVTLYDEFYVQRLRIYPHALRQANAYYSPDKVALLFGYFPERLPASAGETLGGMVFTCLSHDIVAHETTHALLDGLHRRYQDASNLDVLAFHEAFADIVAIFQHFTFPDLLRFEIARTRGDLRTGQLMADLARQFGEALGRSKALRSAIHVDPATVNYATTEESHERGSILVAAVFAAFLKIYQRRIDDLLRIATGGSGVLRPGALHPDLVARLAEEATKSAEHVLRICIRALDYCPPVDVTFSDYLRALITADSDLVAEDKHGYRVAFLEAFGERGIYPDTVRTLSVESLRWRSPLAQPEGLGSAFRAMSFSRSRGADRREAFDASRRNARILHRWIAANLGNDMARLLGLERAAPDAWPGEYPRDRTGRPKFEVHSVRPAYRVSPEGDIKTTVVAVITQRRMVPIDPADPKGAKFVFRGGCTLIVDPAKDEDPILYSVVRSISSKERAERQRTFLRENQGMSLHALYFGGDSFGATREPFALLHMGH